MELRYMLDAFFVMSYSIHLWKWSMENRSLDVVEGEGEAGEEVEVEGGDEVAGSKTPKWVFGIFEHNKGNCRFYFYLFIIFFR